MWIKGPDSLIQKITLSATIKSALKKLGVSEKYLASLTEVGLLPHTLFEVVDDSIGSGELELESDEQCK